MMKRTRRVVDRGILIFAMKHGMVNKVTAHAGLPLVVEALRALRLDEVVEQKLHVSKRRRYSELAKLEALVTLLAAGGNRVEDIRILSEDKGLLRLLGRRMPSPDALLDFLGGFHDAKVWGQRPAGEMSWVPPESESLAALGDVNEELVRRAARPETRVATVDHDGTVIESHKRGATVAYEGTRGYQPLVAVWKEEDLIVADEFRDGNVPGGKDPLTSVKRAFDALPKQVTKRYFRGDSADYYTPLLKYLVKEGVRFSISADMSKELRDCCSKVPRGQWEELERREREVVDLAEVEFAPGHWSKKAEPLRYVALRFTARQGELFSDGEGVRYLAVVSNRRELSKKELVRWHWGKAGTIEHTHRVMKDELGAGVLPSAQFGANAAWFRCNVITYNLLTLLRRRALPERYQNAHPKRLRFEIFAIPGRLAMPQGKLTVTVPTGDERYMELVSARERLWLMRQALGRPKTTPNSARTKPPVTRPVAKP
jgi:hypothetical protein